MWLRKSTASQYILLGPFLDDTDGKTPETGLTINGSDIKLWKEGTNVEVNKNSTGATHVAGGRYYALLDATDTNTLGKMEINVQMTGALPVRREYMVLPAVVYDALVLGTDNLDVSTVQLAGQTVTAGAGVTFPSSVASPTNITALPSIPAGWITAAGIDSGALNGKGDWNVGKTGYSLTQSFPSNFGSMSISAGGLVDITQAAADKAWGTASRVLTAGTNISLAKGTGITGFNDLDAAGVAAATWNAAIASYGSGGSYGSLIETNLDAPVSAAGGGSLTAADIADAVWDEALASHATAGSAGAGVSAAGSAGDPWATLLPGAYGAGTAGQIIGDNLDAAVSGASAPSAADVADAVWDEAISAHLTSGTTGAGLNAAGSAGDPWATVLPGAYGAGTAGKILGDNLNATISSRSSQTSVDTLTGYVDTEVAAIKAKTDYLPSATAGAAGGLLIAGSNAATSVNITGNLTGNVTGSVGSVTGAVGSVTGAVGSVTAGVTLASGTHTGAVIPTVTTLTNLPAITSGWLTASGIAAGALNGKGDWLNAAGVAGAVWNAAISSYGTTGTYGERIEVNLDAQVSGISGGGGGGSLTADQVTAMSAILGIPTSGTTPTDPTTGILDTIRDAALAVKAKTDNLPADPADASDISAAIAVTNGKVDAVQADTDNIQTRLPAALVGGRMDANLGAINNSTTARDAFHRAVKGNVIGTVGGGSTTTSIVSSALTPAGGVADKYKGRLIVFTDDTTTVNLRGQATDITSNTSAANPTFGVTALTTAPVSGDSFVIL
jgi:hypothetical protein